MLHHALDLSFVETSLRLFLNAGLLTQAEVKDARREPSFVQVSEASVGTPGGGSRWQHLYARETAVTGIPARTVGEFIPTVLTTMTATAYLARQLDALRHLQDRPTAALERVFAEHIDLCSYRLDAWYGGLMSRQLRDHAPVRRGAAAGPLSRRLGLAGRGPARVQVAAAGRAAR